MDRYQFEDSISEYIENTLTLSQRKDFEDYIENNPESVVLVERVRSVINNMQKMPDVKTSPDFMGQLMRKVDVEKNRPAQRVKPGNTVFGFTPLYAGLMSVAVIGLIMIGLQMIPDSSQGPTPIPNNFTHDRGRINESSQGPTPIPNNFTQESAPVQSPATQPHELKMESLAGAEEDSANVEVQMDKRRSNIKNKIQLVKNQ